jgi:O-antigen ligase
VRRIYRVALFVLFLALALFGLIQGATTDLEQSSGPYKNSNHFGGAMGLGVPWLLGATLLTLRRSDGGSRWGLLRFALLITTLLCVAATVSSASKAAAILVGTSLLVLLLVSLRGTRARLIVTGGAALSLAVAVPLLGASRLGERFQQLVALTADGVGELGRAVSWGAALSLLRDYPLTGIGFGAFGEVFPGYMPAGSAGHWAWLHNDYLQVLVEGGIVAAILVAWLALGFWSRALDRSVLRLSDGVVNPEHVGLLLGLAALSVHAILDFNHQIPANALLFVTLAAMAVAGGRGSGTEEQGRLGRLRRPLGIVLAIGLVAPYGARALDTWIGDSPDQLPSAKSQQLTDAYREATRAITTSPASGGPWAKLGKVYRRGGRPDLAIGMTRVAIEREPANFVYHDRLATMLWELDLVEPALAAVRRSARVQPVFRYHSYKRYDPVPEPIVDAFAAGSREALGHAPYLRRARHLIALGRVELRRGNLGQAEADLRAAQHVPGDAINRAEAHYYLGLVMTRQGRYAEALENLELARKHRYLEPYAIAATRRAIEARDRAGRGGD